MQSGKCATRVGVQVNEPSALAEATLTPSFLAKIEALLVRTRFIATACGLLGLARRTYYQWKKEGDALRTTKLDAELTSRERALVAFCTTVDRGIALGELEDLDTITEASRSNWRAAAWRLERRAPQRWGKKRAPSKLSPAQVHEVAAEVASMLRDQDHHAAPTDRQPDTTPAAKPNQAPASTNPKQDLAQLPPGMFEAVLRETSPNGRRQRAILEVLSLPEQIPIAITGFGK